MAPNDPDATCQRCNRKGRRVWAITTAAEPEEWAEWCDPCISTHTKEVRQVLVAVSDFLKVQPEHDDYDYVFAKER